MWIEIHDNLSIYSFSALGNVKGHGINDFDAHKSVDYKVKSNDETK
jgi:hypothetical protein